MGLRAGSKQPGGVPLPRALGAMNLNKMKIGGIMQSDGRALIKVMSVPDHAGVAGTVLGVMGEKGINIELLVESFDLDDCGNFSLVIDQKDLDHALTLLEEIKPDIDAKVISYTPDVAVITVFGPHLREKPRIHGVMFSTIASHPFTQFFKWPSYISSINSVIPSSI